ncbi:MAG: ATP-binding protein [Gammaproteobacteria bacterium]
MKTKDHFYFLLLFCGALVFLAVDYMLPLGISAGNFYLLLIFIFSFLIESKKVLYTSMAISCAFIILGYFISPISNEEHFAFINRIISIGLILIASFTGSIFIDYRLKEKGLKEQFILAMNSAPNPMSLVASDGQIIFANDSMHRLFIYAEKELIGKNVQELIPSELKDKHASHINQYFQHPEQKNMGDGRDLIGKKSNGEIVYLEIGINPLNIGNRNMVIIGLNDLSERLSYQKEIEKKLNERDMFSYSLSHDFTGFLRRIQGFSDSLLKKVENSDNKNIFENSSNKEYLEHISSECNKAQTLVNDLGSYISNVDIKENFEEISLNKIFEDITSNNSDFIKEHDAKIKVDKLSSLYCVESHIYLLFGNIVLNAIKHNSNGISINIDQKLADKTVTISIQDNGNGIDQKFIESIFIPFKKNHADGNTQGSGLGMAIAKNIVEQHKGKIWVESTKGKGATFFTEFPLKDPN